MADEKVRIRLRLEIEPELFAYLQKRAKWEYKRLCKIVDEELRIAFNERRAKGEL